eukprot:403353388
MSVSNNFSNQQDFINNKIVNNYKLSEQHYDNDTENSIRLDGNYQDNQILQTQNSSDEEYEEQNFVNDESSQKVNNQTQHQQQQFYGNLLQMQKVQQQQHQNTKQSQNSQKKKEKSQQNSSIQMKENKQPAKLNSKSSSKQNSHRAQHNKNNNKQMTQKLPQNLDESELLDKLSFLQNLNLSATNILSLQQQQNNGQYQHLTQQHSSNIMSNHQESIIQNGLEKAKTYEQLYKSEKQRNEIQKQKISLLEQEKNELIYQLEQFQGFEVENVKYQELVQKFEHQTHLKDQEFKRVKDQIKLKFAENENVIQDLKSQLQAQKDLRQQDSIKFAEDVEKFQQRVKGWELDCQRLESLKKNNEQLIVQMRAEHKQKIGLLKNEIDKFKRNDQLNQTMIQENQNEREKFKSEISELEQLIQNKLHNEQQVDIENLQREFQVCKSDLQKEKQASTKLKESFQQNMDRLLHEKNTISKDYKDLKSQLLQHSDLIQRQDQTIKDLLNFKEEQNREIDRIQNEKEQLEREVTRTAQLLKEMTDAQQLTCSKFSEFQKDIQTLLSENKQLKYQIQSMGSFNRQDQKLISGKYLSNQQQKQQQIQLDVYRDESMQNSQQSIADKNQVYEPAHQYKQQNQQPQKMTDFQRQQMMIQQEYQRSFYR